MSFAIQEKRKKRQTISADRKAWLGVCCELFEVSEAGGMRRARTRWRLGNLGVAGEIRIQVPSATLGPLPIASCPRSKPHHKPGNAKGRQPGQRQRNSPKTLRTQTWPCELPAPCQAAVSGPRSRTPSPARSRGRSHDPSLRALFRTCCRTEAAEDRTSRRSKAPPLPRLKTPPAFKAPGSAAAAPEIRGTCFLTPE